MSLDTRTPGRGKKAKKKNTPAPAPAARGAGGGRGKRSGRKKERTKRRRLFSAPPPPAPREESGLTPFNARGTKLRRRQRAAARGFYAPLVRGAPTTSRDAEVLNTAVVASPTGLQAPMIGIETLSESPLHHDPFLAYEAGLISSPNVLVVGDVGAGKSSLLKTGYALRPLLLRDRRVVVFDKKDRGGEGEYAELTRLFGGDPITFGLGGEGVVLNLLDPVIAGAGASNQLRLLIAAAELTQDTALDEWEREALRGAYRIVMRAVETRPGTQAVLTDVLTALGRLEDDPTGAYRGLSAGAKERLHQAALGVRFLLTGLLEEYSGVFDGPTSPGVRLNRKLTSFDISQLPDDGPVVPIVMAIANMWLLGSLRTDRGIKTNLIVEEGWHLVAGPNAKLLRSNTKLARGLGLALVVAIHKIADIPPDSPAMAVLQEAQTVHIYSQSRAADVARCVNDFNLDPSAASLIGRLGQFRGRYLFKRGSEPELLVRHTLSDLETKLTNTDEAMNTPGGQQ